MNAVIGLNPRRRQDSRSALAMKALGEYLKAQVVSREQASFAGTPDVYIQFSYKLSPALQAAMDEGIPFVIVDGGYFYDRDECVGLSFNGFNGLAQQVELPAHSRWHPKPQPWREPGEFIYIYGQMPKDRSLRGLEIETWMRRKADWARETYGKTVIIRPHPRMVNSWEPLPPLDHTFEDTFVAISYTSTAAVQSIIAGVPTHVEHPASIAWPARIQGHRRHAETRAKWLHRLSWHNYRLPDLHKAAEFIKDHMDEISVAATRGEYDTEGLRP